MSSSTTVNHTIGDKPQSAFSAVVRKSFSSFSVDSILGGASPSADGGPTREEVEEVRRRTEEELRSVLERSGSSPSSNFLLPDEASELKQQLRSRRADTSSPDRSSDRDVDGEDLEEDIHVDSDVDEKDLNDEDGVGSQQQILRPTALGPLPERFTGVPTSAVGPQPPSLLPHHLQSGLWPSLPFLHHQLSLRAFNSK